MKYILTAVNQALFTPILLLAISLGASGCSDSATVNPEVELASLTVTLAPCNQLSAVEPPSTVST